MSVLNIKTTETLKDPNKILEYYKIRGENTIHICLLSKIPEYVFYIIKKFRNTNMTWYFVDVISVE